MKTFFFTTYVLSIFLACIFTASVVPQLYIIDAICLMLFSCVCHLTIGIHINKPFCAFLNLLISFIIIPAASCFLPSELGRFFIASYSIVCFGHMLTFLTGRSIFNYVFYTLATFIVLANCLIYHDNIYSVIFDLTFSLGFAGLMNNLLYTHMIRISDYMIHLKDYLVAMKKPMIAFFMSYLVIVIIATFVNVILYHHNHNYFSTSEAFTSSFDVVMAMFFYSLQTFGINNYSLIEPTSAVAEYVITFFSLLGTLWLVVVLAAVLGYLQSAFETINRRKKAAMKKSEQAIAAAAQSAQSAAQRAERAVRKISHISKK